MIPDAWRTVGAVPRLAVGEVQVWRAVLNGFAYSSDLSILSAEERQRAEQFHFQRDRARYVAARATLRRLLGAYVEAPPEELEFRTAEFGKPHLVRGGGRPDIRFNVSHSHEAGLFAFTVGTDVGVDIEHRRENVELLDLAERFFTRAEANDVRNALPAERPLVFYACWSRKEACMKAIGAGLQVPLDAILVGGVAITPTLQLAVPMADQTHDLVVYAVPPVDGYSAALATCGASPLRPTFLRVDRAAGDMR